VLPDEAGGGGAAGRGAAHAHLGELLAAQAGCPILSAVSSRKGWEALNHLSLRRAYFSPIP
jgi:hypothetical protein